jgi:hypothetical protein
MKPMKKVSSKRPSKCQALEHSISITTAKIPEKIKKFIISKVKNKFDK